MPIDAVLRELLVRQLDHWLPGALHRSRRATLALSYAGDPGTAEAALRVVAGFADRLRGRRLTVLVLADGGPEVPARLGVVEATLPADVAVHVVSGDPARLPVVLKAAGAAGAPLLTLIDGGAPDPALLAATTTGRPAEVLLTAAATHALRPALTAAGFPPGRRGRAGARRRVAGPAGRLRHRAGQEPGGVQGRALGRRRVRHRGRRQVR